MSNWLRQNLGLIILSLILAFFFWAMAIEQEDPIVEAPFGNPVTVEVRGLPEGMIAYGNVKGARVWIELKAPQSVLDALKSEDIHAYLDLTGVQTGTLELPIQVEVEPRPAQVIEVSPAEIELVVERITEKEVPVNEVLQGTPAVGYESGTALVVPRTVLVSGPESQVAQVSHARVVVPIDNQQGNVRSDYQPVPVDDEENVVPEVTTIPEAVTVNVPIAQRGYPRDLAVTVALEGQPAPGYRISNLEVQPPTVRVSGNFNVVRSAPGFLQTEPIRLEEITRSLTTRVALQMPEGLSILSPPQPEVTVTLSVDIIRSGMTHEVVPEIRGLRQSLTATVSVDSVVVILSGPLAVMDMLDVEQIDLTLDLTNLEPGDYAIVPVVSVPDQIVIEKIVPEAVPVTIAERQKEPENSFR